MAVLGAGTMGSAMARNLLRAGLPVDVWDRTPAAAARLAGHGATARSSPGEAVVDADVAITMLPDAGAVTSVALGQGMLKALTHGAIWAQMGTIGVRATEQMAASVADQRPDVRFVDAPVSGTRGPAKPASCSSSRPVPSRPARRWSPCSAPSAAGPCGWARPVPAAG